jgi:hypothetical protein
MIRSFPSKSGQEAPQQWGAFFVVRPAGRNYLEVKVLCSPGKGKS